MAAAAVVSAKSLLKAQIPSMCTLGNSGQCFAECQVAAACPAGLACDPGCGLCGCSACPACEASTHVGSWHIANIARAFLKLATVDGVSADDRATLVCSADTVAKSYAAFSGIKDAQKRFTTREDWISNQLYQGLFFDDLGWWALALFDLAELPPAAVSGCTGGLSQTDALVAALNITAINSSAYSNLCGGGAEWNCPNWTVDSAQKNTVTNMLNIISLLRAVPHLANQPPGAPTATAADYLARVQTLWKWYSTHALTDPTLHYGDNQTHVYKGTVGLFNVLPGGQVVLGDAMSTSQTAKYGSCTPCTQRMEPGGTCGDIACDIVTINQWTYNYGVVVAALLEMAKAGSKLDTTLMGPHTDFVALAIAVANTSVAPSCLAVTTYLGGTGLDASTLGFFEAGVVQERCTTWAGKICNADQFIFRGIYLDWLADLVSYCRAAGVHAADADRYTALIASTGAALVKNATTADGAAVYPFQWNNPSFDWCKPCAACNVTTATCEAFYAANGHNRFEVSNQAAGLKALTAAAQVGGAAPPPPPPPPPSHCVCPTPCPNLCPACPACPAFPECPSCPLCPGSTERGGRGGLIAGAVAAGLAGLAVVLLIILLARRARVVYR